MYSDEPRLIDQTFALGDEEQEVLDSGGSDAEVSDLSRSENSYDQQLGRVLEVYTWVEAPGGEQLLFELYLTDANLEARADELFRLLHPLTVGGLLLFLLLTTPLVWVVSRRADAAAADRERLLVMAADASDAERRSLLALRSLLVEIYPPRLEAAGLGAPCKISWPKPNRPEWTCD